MTFSFREMLFFGVVLVAVLVAALVAGLPLMALLYDLIWGVK